MTNDPIADLLIQIKNGYMAHLKKVTLPYSKNKEIICQILQKAGYVGKTETQSTDKGKKNLAVNLIYIGKNPRMKQVVRVSKPGRRVYVDKNSIPRVLGGIGLAIISTSAGILADREAKKKNLGGELLCKIW